MFSISPIPENDEEAWDEFDDREETNEDSEMPPHPKMVELIKKLTEKYPCVTKVPESEIENVIWADGPLENNIIGDLAIFAVAFSKIEESFDHVVETAKSLGIVCYDPQEEVIYRP